MDNRNAQAWVPLSELSGIEDDCELALFISLPVKVLLGILYGAKPAKVDTFRIHTKGAARCEIDDAGIAMDFGGLNKDR